jgi:hypothetical protein
MGVVCCCSKRIEIANQSASPNDIVDQLMKNKLTKKQLIYECFDERNKIYLIKFEHIDALINNKNLFKIPKYGQEDINSCYCNSFMITNFIGKRNIILTLLQHINGPEKQESSIYHVEDICYIETTNNNILEVLKNDLKLKIMKNYIFVGIVNNSRNSNKVFKLVYKKNPDLTLEVNYLIHAVTGSLDEDNLKSILKEDKFKNKLLKSIMMDKSNGQKVYYLIFEEDNRLIQEYNSVVLTIESGSEDNENIPTTIIKKLTSFQLVNYKLTCLFSEKDKTYLILYKEIETND